MPLPVLSLRNLVGGKKEIRRLSQLADAARDARRWNEAVQHYSAVLALAPDLPAIWVQLGHSHKEAGQIENAAAAYARADTLRPGDADLHVQMGHLSKLRGNLDAAAQYYRKAYALGSTDSHASEAAGAMAREAAVTLPRSAKERVEKLAEREQGPVFYLDVSDLLLHFHNNRFPTGIQRVQIELFKASLEWRGPAEIRTVVFSHNPQFWTDIEPISFRRLCALASMPGSKDDPEWQGASRHFITSLEAQPASRMPRGSVVVNVGTSWWMPNYMQVVREAKARFGIKYVPMVHDLIPMIVPEFLDGNLGPVFSGWISSVFLHADATLVNSQNTGRDLAQAAASVRPLRHPPVVMPLDAAAPPPQEAALSVPERKRTLARFDLSENGYVLFVGTFEARKNHILVFQCWLRLVQQEPRDRVPVLLCVGKRGWRFDAADHFLRSHPELADKIVMLSGVSDVELQSLFLGCLFSVYNSVYEGWGLPVTESLSYGKACLTPGHSSLPEAGGPFADYYDGTSLASLLEQVHRLIFDHQYRKGREAHIAAEYRPRSWEDLLEGLVNGLAPQIVSPPAADTFVAPIAWNVVYPFTLMPGQHAPDIVAATGEMLRAGNHWHEIDDWGVWSKRDVANIAFLVPDLGESESSASVLIRMHVASDEVTATISTGGSVLKTLPPGPSLSRLLRFELPFVLLAEQRRKGQPITLSFRADQMCARSVHGEDKLAGIGLSLFAICRSSDVAARLNLLEQAVLTTFVARDN